MVHHLQFRDTCFIPLNADQIKTLTQALKHVETLTVINSIYYSYDGEASYRYVSFFTVLNLISFDNLQQLNLKIYDGFEIISWAQFIANNPRVKTIVITLYHRQDHFDFNQLVLNARIGTKLTMGGSFQLSQERLRYFKENSSREVRLQVGKKSLMMRQEVFDEIMGEDKEKIEFL
jgi:hypothetical protein